MSEADELARELEALRARYAVMVEQAPEAIVVFDIDDGHFVEVNEAACRFYGLQRDELLATGPVGMSPPEQPDGMPSVQAAAHFIQYALVKGPVEFEWTHVDASGEPIPCRIHLAHVPSPPRRLVRGVLMDLRDVRAAERARARLLRIVEESSDLIGMATAEGEILFMNAAGRAQLGYGADEAIEGRPITTHYPPEAVETVLRPALEEACRVGRWHGTNEMRAADGRRIPVSQVIIAHRGDDGEIEYMSTIARDVSAEQSRERARGLESLGVLAGGIAHDFNNLLVGVMGNARLMLDELPETSSLRPFATRIETASLRAADIAEQMLEYAGMTPRERTVVDVGALVPDVEDLLRPKISPEAEIVTELGNGPTLVDGNPTQLRRVLMNLLLNASDALGGARGRITVRTGRATPTVGALRHDFLTDDARSSECVFLEVEDTGPGLEPAEVERIFEPFYSTKFTGRGLGLATLLGIARAHGAAISVDSRPGAGTRFRLWFPPTSAANDVAPESTADEPPAPSVRRVLVVEDEPSVRAVMRAALESAEIDVREAADGVEGLTALRSDERGFDVVVLDLTMPGLSGDELVMCMRELAPDQPIVLTSGYTVSSLDADGPSLFLPKPFRPLELRDAVAEAATLSRRSRDSRTA